MTRREPVESGSTLVDVWERTPEQIEIDHRAAEMRSRSMTYEQIGQQLGVTRQAAHKMVQRAIEDIPKEGGENARAMELMKLDYIERRAFVIANTKHPAISAGGKVVLRQDGGEVEDATPVLKALDTLLKVSLTRAKLLGLNAPTKTELTGKDGGPISVENYRERIELFLESMNG